MSPSRLLLAAGCGAALGIAAWLSNAESNKPSGPGWAEVAPGVLRTAGQPYGYALVEDRPRPSHRLPDPRRRAQGSRASPPSTRCC